MPRVLNKRFHGVPDGAVYIGRPSKWGNPFHIRETVYGQANKIYSRSEAIELYETYLNNNQELQDQLHELRGKDLVCWCAPEPCHGDILLKLANG